MDILKKSIKIKYFLFLVFILTSCKNETCKGVEFRNGISYKNGKLYSGTCITHHSNGEVRSIQSYLNGYDHGDWEFFYANKKQQTKGGFIMGKKNGKWTYYHENGMLFKEHFYENGKKIGVWITYDKNGEISSKTNDFN